MSVAVFIIVDKISIADFVRQYFDNPKATRCRSSLFNGFSIIGLLYSSQCFGRTHAGSLFCTSSYSKSSKCNQYNILKNN